jgi:hypothetical protein
MPNRRNEYDPQRAAEAQLSRSVRSSDRTAGRIPPAKIVRWTAGAVAALLFALCVYSETVALDQNASPPSFVFPALVYIALLVVLFSALGPVLMEFKTTRQRVARVIVGVLICAIVSPIVIAGILGIVGLIATFLP